MSKTAVAKDAAEKAMAAESDRTRHLLGMAERFTAGTIVVTGFDLFEAAAFLNSSPPLVKASCFLSLAVLGFSLFLGFFSLRLKGYAGYPRGDKLWENLKSDEVTESAAELAVIQLLLKTREQNAKLNDKKASSLFWCGWLLFAGVLLVVGSQLLNALADV